MQHSWDTHEKWKAKISAAVPHLQRFSWSAPGEDIVGFKGAASSWRKKHQENKLEWLKKMDEDDGSHNFNLIVFAITEAFPDGMPQMKDLTTYVEKCILMVPLCVSWLIEKKKTKNKNKGMDLVFLVTYRSRRVTLLIFSKLSRIELVRYLTLAVETQSLM